MEPKAGHALIPPDTFNPEMPTFVIGGGPSISQIDPESIRGCQMVTTNNQWRLWPEAAVHFAQDESWWLKYGMDFKAGFKGKYFATCKPHRNNGEIYGAFGALIYNQTRNGQYIRDTKQMRDGGMSTHIDCLRGCNSGQSAINLAYHCGARLVILLGFDMRAVDGRCHWHEEKDDGITRASRAYVTSFIPCLNNAAPEYAKAGMRVINCTPGSALECFERGDVADWLPGVAIDSHHNQSLTAD